MNDSAADDGHNDLVAQPHTPDEGPVAEAEIQAAEMTSPEQPLGEPGKKFDRRSPFFIGLAASAGVAVTYGAVHLLAELSSILTVIGVAFFLALGLEPVVSRLVNHGLPRWLSTALVFVVFVAGIATFAAAAFPPLFAQITDLVNRAPLYLQQAQDHSSFIGRLNDRFQLQQRFTDAVDSIDGSALNHMVSAGTAVVEGVADTLIAIVLTLYFLADMPRIRSTLYRLVPHTRRPRAILIGDEVFAKVGAYVLGNVLISLLAGAATLIWLTAFDVPYPLLLAILVAILDLLPVVGSTIAGIVVGAVALTVSIPVCLATIVFYIAFQMVEDYLLVPRIIGRAVHVPALTTIVAVLIGATLLGVVGALVAIPIAAALQLIVQEVLYPRLDSV
ncbi:AI-2E family transporter [Mycobacterium frederiksbergense]|uniref:AI-2E family transporter n=1 Tax=Mycolicibacterium frederiksbergense TaxID=117567 RepID=A0A6H0S7C1_9MYCO|nr:AI-2E family transporter [Mycolicibacterium frederiksbergense]MCV7045294.1 AI-2E family transporter [Mycolicibacterium frederiksbergense]QIV83060.1 AI-2E family transporter [Mycolicibacterium frederiksbergense]